MPLDASLITLGDINRGAWPTEFGLRPASIFSYVMNNYWTTNYRAGQGGSFHFRYVMTSMPVIDDAQLSRSGWQEMTPFEINRITTQDKAQAMPRSLSSIEQSFLQIDDPDVVLTAWKAAEDGNGTILRFLDLGGAPRTVNVQAPLLHIQEAWQADAVERNQQRLSLSGTYGFQFAIRSRQIVTVRIITQ
jgi:alpha-mannosidase